MGDGYWILVWDDYGSGLVMLNPRLHVEGVDSYGNPQNWWPCDTPPEGADVEQLDAAVLARHGLDPERARVLR
jgi:hypothetical protein